MCQRRRKQQCLNYQRAPHYLRFNPFIRKGYRKNLSTFQCFQSILSWTNETLNVWSHVAGFAIFVCLFVYDVTVAFHQYEGTGNDAVVASLVLLSFMVCMALSSLYHTLNCHSEEAYCRWLSYDLFGICTAFLAIFLSGIYYGFWCPELMGLRLMYMGLVGLLFLGVTTFLLSPRLMGPQWEGVRVCLFSGWAVSGLLPTLHWLYLHGGLQSSIVQTFLPRILGMYGISGTGMLVYVWKFPERYFPGYFDFVGASHQLWHVIVVGALVYWHQTGLEYARFRLSYGCPPTFP